MTDQDQDISKKFYIIGNNGAAKRKVERFLKKINLKPIEKEIAVTWVKEGAPFSEDILNTIFAHARVVIFLLTEEDEVCLRKDLQQNNNKKTDRESWFQPTQDQIFEAGYAFGRYHEQVFLIRFGQVQPLSDIAGRYIYDFEDPEHQNALKKRLQVVTDQLNALPPTNGKMAEARQIDPKRVFVVYGRNTSILIEVRAFLHEIGLFPITWEHALEQTGKGSPPVGKILETAFSQAQAVVVLLTGDDLARPKSQNTQEDNSKERTPLVPQPRANVLFEAGMAFGDKRLTDKTILVEFECDELKLCRSISDQYRLRLSDKHREEFIRMLRKVGCAVNSKGKNWHSTGNFYFTYKSREC